MRCVGVCAFLYQSPVAVPLRFAPSQFARKDPIKILQMLFGASRVAGKLRSSSCGSLVVEAGRRARLILSVFALTALTTACANAPPEDASRQSTAVSFDRNVLIRPQPPIAQAHPRRGARAWPALPPTRQSASAAGWRTEVSALRNRMPVIGARE